MFEASLFHASYSITAGLGFSSREHSASHFSGSTQADRDESGSATNTDATAVFQKANPEGSLVSAAHSISGVPGFTSHDHALSPFPSRRQTACETDDPCTNLVPSGSFERAGSKESLLAVPSPITGSPEPASSEHAASRFSRSSQTACETDDPRITLVPGETIERARSEGHPGANPSVTGATKPASQEIAASHFSASTQADRGESGSATNTDATAVFQKANPEGSLLTAAHSIIETPEKHPGENTAPWLTETKRASRKDRSPQLDRNYDKSTSCEAVLLNTAGGMAGGDLARLRFTAGPSSHVTLTTQAQEKIYRSDGPPARVELDINLLPASRLEWLPQETILFHEAKLHRQLRVEMAGDASLLLLESQIFGRLAAGETHTHGSLRETWRIFRAGRLIFAEQLRLEGILAEKLDRKALGDGARAIGTLLFVAPGAEARLENFRTTLPPPGQGLHSAASAWNGMLLARFTAVSPELLRGAMIAALSALRGGALPRVWQI